MRIDAHQHIWTLARGDYDWMSPALGPIYRDFDPADLAPLLEAAGIDGTVLVQAAATTAETSFLLDVAERTPFIKGVVGWINFEDPSDVATLRAFARHPKFRGVRPMIQDIADIDWMLRPDLDWAFRALIELDLTFDLLGFPRHLPNALTLLQRYPEMRAVIDHAMKPTIAAGLTEDWADGIARIARETNAYVKLSGLVTEAGPGWTPAGLAPFVSHVLDVFGPDRVMWGSDWPVLNLASDYARWHAVARDLVAAVAGNCALNAVFGGTAAAFYRLGV
jgi:L-fuconolactonase